VEVVRLSRTFPVGTPDNGFPVRVADVHCRDPRPFRDEGPDNGRTDTVGAADDDDPPVLKLHSFLTFENGLADEAPVETAGWPTLSQ